MNLNFLNLVTSYVINNQIRERRYKKRLCSRLLSPRLDWLFNFVFRDLATELIPL